MATETMTYSAWIEKLTADVDVRGRCQEAVVAMVHVFPELRPARGWYREIGGRTHCHWWCVDPNGIVVDPTRSQFVFAGDYDEITDPELLPTGSCLNCGSWCFGGAQTCCSACADDALEAIVGHRSES